MAVPSQTVPDDPRPVPPVRPEQDDCCRSGCDPCVFDLYHEALERYRVALREWEERKRGREAGQLAPGRNKTGTQAGST